MAKQTGADKFFTLFNHFKGRRASVNVKFHSNPTLESKIYLVMPNLEGGTLVREYNNVWEPAENAMMGDAEPLLKELPETIGVVAYVYMSNCCTDESAEDLLGWIKIFNGISFRFIFGNLSSLSGNELLTNTKVFNDRMLAMLRMLEFANENPDKLQMEFINPETFNKMVDDKKWAPKYKKLTTMSEGVLNHSHCFEALKSIVEFKELAETKNWQLLPKKFLENFRKMNVDSNLGDDN